MFIVPCHPGTYSSSSELAGPPYKIRKQEGIVENLLHKPPLNSRVNFPARHSIGTPSNNSALESRAFLFRPTLKVAGTE